MIYNTYSERQRLASGEADPYQYKDVPKQLRVQIQQILRDAIGPHIQMGAYDMSAPDHNPEIWESIHKTLTKEFGVHSFCRAPTKGQEVIDYLAICGPEHFVDIVEICVRVIHRGIRKWEPYERSSHGIEQDPQEAIDEINHRFRRSGFGYQFVDGEAFRIDSEFTHEEIVKPALRILGAKRYEGARDEFLSAHRHYRNGDHEEAITEAAKSFESTLKIVCDRNDWEYPAGSRASDLLKIIRSKGLWPDYLDNSFDQLLATLSSGLPKVRNEQSAHGQGGMLRSTPGYIAAYALNLAAAKIVFVSEAASAKGDQPIIAT